MRKYRGLALQGGGILGIAHLGVAIILQEQGIYKHLTHFAGTSVGAIIAGLFACRIDPKKIKKLLLRVNLGLLTSGTKSVSNLSTDFGYTNSNKIKIFTEIILGLFIGRPFITFAQVFNTYGSFLIITATDIGEQSTVYYSPETSPEMPIAEAIRRSAAAPPFFTPVSDNGHLYADGGILENYPIQKLYQYLPEDEVFGSRLIPNKYPNVPNTVPTTYEEYMKTVNQMIGRNLMTCGTYLNSIRIYVGDMKPMDFNITREQKRFLIQQGKLATFKFLSQNNMNRH